MKATIQELGKIVSEYTESIGAIPEAAFSAKPLPEKWSKKEVVGHLIDSAQNNLRRFLCGQYETAPPKIIYQQDFWVSSNDYQHADGRDTVALWALLNKRIVAVLEQMPPTNYAKLCDTGRNGISVRTIEWLAEDYVKHLKHHLNQVIPNSFDVTYP